MRRCYDRRMEVRELNNRVKTAYDAGDLDEAERLLDEIERMEGKNELDEYFYRSHRAHVCWSRAAYAAGLPHAERLYELEKAIWLERDIGYSNGAWALISFLTRCQRFADAEAVFAEVLDEDQRRFVEDRRARNQHAFESIIKAGLCAYFENTGDGGAFRRGSELVARAELVTYTRNPDLAYMFACYWARAGDRDRTVFSLETAVHRGYEVQVMLGDPGIGGMRDDPRIQAMIERE
jgi:tetratricopeptide (TPR) repeat protein